MHSLSFQSACQLGTDFILKGIKSNLCTLVIELEDKVAIHLKLKACG